MRVYVYVYIYATHSILMNNQIQNSLQMSEFCWSDLTLHPVPLLAIASTTHPLKRHVSLDALVSLVSKSGWVVLFNKSMSMFDQHKEAQQINGELEKSAIVISRFMLGGGIHQGLHALFSVNVQVHIFIYLSLVFCDEVPQHTEHLPEQNNSSHSLTFY